MLLTGTCKAANPRVPFILLGMHIKVYLESEILKHATRKFSEGDLNYLQTLATRQIPVNTAEWTELWKTAMLTYAQLNA